MAALPVSIVVVSRERPERLLCCMAGIDGLDYPAFEVVVVACPEGAAALERAGFAGRVKLERFDEANISAARNIGIAQATGEVVAFIDDDAVPEPTWLRELMAAFQGAEAAAAGGYVLGRNGISFQWRARQVDRGGRAKRLEFAGDEAAIATPEPGHAVKTEGTNMAVRREVLAAMGGFDPGFRFYLDETDLNLRLADAGLRTALAPRALVHHAYAASARRREDRAVTDLSQIGASAIYFLRKHCPEEERAGRLDEMLREQQMRVFDQVRARLIRKGDVGPLIAGLKAGVEEGKAREIAEMPPLPAVDRPFLRFVPARRGGAVLAGRIWQAAVLRAEARTRADTGENVSLFLFGPSARYHRVRFDRGGFWEQNGGLFGRAVRNEPLIRLTGFAARLRQEVNRVAAQRGLLAQRSQNGHTGQN